MNEKIIECELAYTKCFSDYDENQEIIRFRDLELKDMYHHNYTYIKNKISDEDLINTIENEITVSLSENSTFCNILFNFKMEQGVLSKLSYQPEVSNNGFYQSDISFNPKLKTIQGCGLKKVNNQEMLNDLLSSDLAHDEETIGREFCERRVARRGKVYLSSNGVNSYICYREGVIIGNCDLFIYNGVAKIEDFSVIPQYQRIGYGTTIIKSIIEIALNEDCHTIYLVTDEDDTAKEMYRKIRFTKIGESTNLFFKIV